MSQATRLLERFHRTLIEEIQTRRPEYLTSPFTNASGRWDLVATASAFAFRDDSQSRVLVLNVHNNFNDFEGSWNSLRDLLSASRTRSGDRQLTYAPLVVGDFNVGRATMEEDETGPGDRFEDLAIAGYVESDVIGAALGYRVVF